MKEKEDKKKYVDLRLWFHYYKFLISLKIFTQISYNLFNKMYEAREKETRYSKVKQYFKWKWMRRWIIAHDKHFYYESNTFCAMNGNTEIWVANKWCQKRKIENNLFFLMWEIEMGKQIYVPISIQMYFQSIQRKLKQ